MPTTLIYIIVLSAILLVCIFFLFKSFWDSYKIESVYRLLVKKDFVNAVNRAKKIVARDPENVDAHYLLAKGYMGQGKDKLALKEMAAISRLGRFTNLCKENVFRQEYASLFKNLDNYEEALKEFFLLVEKNPNDATSLYQIAMIFESKGKTAQAVTYFNKTVTANPQYMDAYYQLGLIYYNAQKYEVAKGFFQKILGANPDFYKALLYLGLIAQRSKNYEEAIGYYEKAAKSQDKDTVSRAILYKAESLYLSGKYDIAGKTLLTILQNPEQSIWLEANYVMGIIEEYLNHTDKSMRYFNLVYQKKPDYKDVANKIKGIKKAETNPALRDFVSGNPERFKEICMMIAGKLNVEVRSMSELKNGILIMGVNKTQNEKWEGVKEFPTSILVLRSNHIINVDEVRNFFENMRAKGIMKGMVVTNALSFSQEAVEFAEVRPLELYPLENLEKFLI